MSKQEAANLINRALGSMRLTRDEHTALQQALQTLLMSEETAKPHMNKEI